MEALEIVDKINELPAEQRMLIAEMIIRGASPSHARWLYSNYEHDSAKPARSGKADGSSSEATGNKVALWHQ